MTRHQFNSQPLSKRKDRVWEHGTFIEEMWIDGLLRKLYAVDGLLVYVWCRDMLTDNATIDNVWAIGPGAVNELLKEINLVELFV